MEKNKIKLTKLAAAAVLFSVAIFLIGADLDSARELNREGERLYEAGEIFEALDYFKKAVELDPTSASAHYNLAATLGIIRQMRAYLVCDYGAYKPVILDHLEEAIRLKPRLLKRAMEDERFNSVSGTFRFQRLLGLSIENEGEAETILKRVSWYGPVNGSLGPEAWINFMEKGRMEYWFLDMKNGGMREYLDGNYVVEGNRVSIKLAGAVGGRSAFEGTISADGVLDIPGLSGPFTDDPHDCEE